MSRTFALLALAAAFGCSESRKQTSPLGPSLTAPPVSVPQQSLHGYVADTAFQGIAGARIEVVDGPQAGMSLLSDAGGLFSYMGTFASPVTFRVSRDGYIAATETSKTSVAGGRPWVYVRLETVAAPVNLVGDYTLTLTADNSCTDIPSEWRTRTYAATLTPLADPLLRPNTLLTLTATGAPFLASHDAFPIGVAGDEVGFSVYYQGEDFGLVEQIGPGTFLAYQGAAVSVGGSSVSTISARLDGIIDYCALRSESGWNYDCNSGPANAHVRCQSKNHRITLTRR